jgi:glycerol-3-phosphate dehydrogenase
VFVMPFERDFTLIGTTELPFAGDSEEVGAAAEEIAYLCRAVGRWFRKAPQPDEVLWAFAGVRPLYDDRAGNMAAVSRDYVFELDEAGAPALSIFGGKLTTYRRLAEQALARLAAHLSEAGPAWTAASALPGGTGLPSGGAVALAAELQRRSPTLYAATTERLARSYGGDAHLILANGELGRDFGHGLFAAEIDWLVAQEWARTAEDVLWRRGKLGLRFSPAEVQALRDYLANSTALRPAAATAAAAPRMPDR